MWLDGVFSKRFPPSQAELEAYERIFDAPTPGKKIALLLALVVVMPVCDELFFRGALFTPLKRGRRAESVILATAAYDTLLAVRARVRLPRSSSRRWRSPGCARSPAACSLDRGAGHVLRCPGRAPRDGPRAKVGAAVALAGVGLAALSPHGDRRGRKTKARELATRASKTAEPRARLAIATSRRIAGHQDRLSCCVMRNLIESVIVSAALASVVACGEGKPAESPRR